MLEALAFDAVIKVMMVATTRKLLIAVAMFFFTLSTKAPRSSKPLRCPDWKLNQDQGKKYSTYHSVYN